MIRGALCFICIVVFFTVELTAGVNVKINIHNKTVRPGDSLTIECMIYEPSVGLRTLFFCLFMDEKSTYCFKKCISYCQQSPCTNRDKFIDSIRCYEEATKDLLTHTYTIPVLSADQINNRKVLTFSCRYKGLNSYGNVTVLETSQSKTKETVPPSVQENSKSSTTVKNTVPITKDLFGYNLQDIISIILISVLIASFFLNIWCCVQCCIRRSKQSKTPMCVLIIMEALLKPFLQRTLFRYFNFNSPQ